VGEPIPELRQPPEEGTKVPSSAAGQDTGHVFPDDPARPEAVNQPEIDEGEIAAGVVEALAEPCDGEGLAGSASHEKVD
jgi:hypothetical protein